MEHLTCNSRKNLMDSEGSLVPDVSKKVTKIFGLRHTLLKELHPKLHQAQQVHSGELRGHAQFGPASGRGWRGANAAARVRGTAEAGRRPRPAGCAGSPCTCFEGSAQEQLLRAWRSADVTLSCLR